MPTRRGSSVSVFGVIEGFCDSRTREPRYPLVQTKEYPSAPLWKFPGGRRENGESPEVCLMREIEEEIGVLVDVPEDLVFETKVQHNHSFLLYRVRYYHGVPTPGHEIARVGLFSAGEIDALIARNKMLPCHVNAFREYQKKRS